LWASPTTFEFTTTTPVLCIVGYIERFLKWKNIFLISKRSRLPMYLWWCKFLQRFHCISIHTYIERFWSGRTYFWFQNALDYLCTCGGVNFYNAVVVTRDRRIVSWVSSFTLRGSNLILEKSGGVNRKYSPLGSNFAPRKFVPRGIKFIWVSSPDMNGHQLHTYEHDMEWWSDWLFCVTHFLSMSSPQSYRTVTSWAGQEKLEMPVL
jgi:hypothetical protein